MKTLLRVAAFAAVAFTFHASQTWWLARIQPDISTSAAIRQLNGDAADATAARWFETEKNLLEAASSAALLAAAVLLFQQPVRRALARIPRRRALVLPLLLAAGSLVGCMRPYDRPEFVTIRPIRAAARRRRTRRSGSKAPTAWRSAWASTAAGSRCSSAWPFSR